ncbi:hypothetical protein BV20DRAFT_973358 [Pilatotrama ljubarskyi]|nr:hypothetical protein BV20DRAFT_973358 [Pilatotrama ljubarskyi]
MRPRSGAGSSRQTSAQLKEPHLSHLDASQWPLALPAPCYHRTGQLVLSDSTAPPFEPPRTCPAGTPTFHTLARMPALSVRREDEGSGALTPKQIVGMAFALTLFIFLCVALCLLGRKKCLAKRARAAQSSPSSRVAVRGGVVYPTSTPRKWKAWQKARVDDEIYGNGCGFPGRLSPLRRGSSQHSRSTSSLSGTSSFNGEHALPILPMVAVPPPAWLEQPPVMAQLPL